MSNHLEQRAFVYVYFLSLLIKKITAYAGLS